MSIKSLGNPRSTYNAVWGQTAKGAVTPKPGPFEASGGTKTTSGDQTIHTFDYPNSDTFVVTGSPKTCEILVIAGGGSGGSAGNAGWQGGGGGAGGYAYATGHEMGAGTYTITVGAGAAGVDNPDGSQDGPRGGWGADSIFTAPTTANTIHAEGGGGGGAGYTPGESTQMWGANGGSSGGAGSTPTSQPTIGPTNPNSWPALQPTQNPAYSNGTLTQAGYPGGYESGGTGDGVGGGGGGAGGAGTPSPQSPTPTTGGGAGVSNSISGASVTYCEGGYSWGGPGPVPSINHTTKGSGGLGAPSASVTSGAGQPGIVIISYPTPT